MLDLEPLYPILPWVSIWSVQIAYEAADGSWVQLANDYALPKYDMEVRYLDNWGALYILIPPTSTGIMTVWM